MAESRSVLPSGTRLARRYVIESLVGDGGMAQVYRGEHETIGRPVAIKVLGASFTHRPDVVVRFLQEAKASSKVRHENIVEITDFGETDDGRPFMVMEYLEGEDLATTLLRDGPMPWERARPILLQILAALQATHGQGVIHRDLKPENVFRIRRMGNDDFVKIFDFGIAKVLRTVGSAAKSLTIEGQVLGTPAYMSPEQCQGEKVDARSDLYAVGILAYEMLTGRTPFEDRHTVRLMTSQVYDEVPPMAQRAPHVSVDPRVEALVVRALAKKPKHRYQSAAEFAEAVLADVDPKAPGLLQTLREMFRG